MRQLRPFHVCKAHREKKGLFYSAEHEDNFPVEAGECKAVTFQSDSGCFHLYEYPLRLPRGETGLLKLNFQVMHRTMATQAQSRGSVKDIQAHPRHAKADAAANEYMRELPESVRRMAGPVYITLKEGTEGQQLSGDLLPKAINA